MIESPLVDRRLPPQESAGFAVRFADATCRAKLAATQHPCHENVAYKALGSGSSGFTFNVKQLISL
jgi:hypothetical protein